MVEIDTHERTLNPWPSYEDIFWKRNNFILDNKEAILAPIQSFDIFSDLTPSQQDNAAQLVSRFFFGVHMAYHRFGDKYDNYILAYDLNSENEYSSFGFVHDKNEYSVKVDFLKVAATGMDSGPIFFSGGAIKGALPGDACEIAGVEEAAHLMFFNEKGHMGDGEVVNANEKIRVYTSDTETRAMRWKLAYTKRYFPQYYDSLKETADKATEARISSK